MASRIALLAVVMTFMMAPGHLLLPILQCLVIVQSISLACALVCLYATLMSLSSPLQAGVDFTLFQCTDAAIAIWLVLSAALLLNILAMRPASCLPGYSRCWRRGLLISGCIRQEN